MFIALLVMTPQGGGGGGGFVFVFLAGLFCYSSDVLIFRDVVF